MALNPSMTTDEILNNSVELQPSQKITIGAANAASAAINSSYVKVVASSDCWIVAGAAPVAAAADGYATFLPAGIVFEYKITLGQKLGVIQDTAGGSLYITPGK